MQINIYPNINFNKKQTTNLKSQKINFKGLKFVSIADEFVPMQRLIKEQSERFISYGTGAIELGQGLFSKVYRLVNLNNIVIKQSLGTDTFEAEEKAMRKIPAALKTSQHFVARAINDSNGKYFILSTAVQGRSPNPKTAPLTKEHLKNLFNGLFEMDRECFYHGDLNNGNIKITPDGNVNFIDFQWATKIDKTQSFSNKKAQCLPEFIPIENAQMYEMADLPYYLSKIDDPIISKNFLRNYLKEKSIYHAKRAEYVESLRKSYYGLGFGAEEAQRYESAQALIFQKPPEIAITSELLKMQFLNSYRESYHYVDGNLKDKNILPVGSAYLYTVNFIKNFNSFIQNPQNIKSPNETLNTYLEKQNKFGRYWWDNIENWSNGSFEFPLRQIRDERKTWEKIFDFENPNVNIEKFGNMLNLTEKVDNSFSKGYTRNFDFKNNDVSDIINVVADRMEMDKYCGSRYGMEKLFAKKDELNKAYYMLLKSYENDRGLDVINSGLLLALRGKQMAETAEKMSSGNQFQSKIIESLRMVGYNIRNWSARLSENVYKNIYKDITSYNSRDLVLGYEKMNNFNIEI